MGGRLTGIDGNIGESGILSGWLSGLLPWLQIREDLIRLALLSRTTGRFLGIRGTVGVPTGDGYYCLFPNIFSTLFAIYNQRSEGLDIYFMVEIPIRRVPGKEGRHSRVRVSAGNSGVGNDIHGFDIH